jgi:cytochrome c-type biogenesis protein CcmH/NrfG
MQKQKQIKLNKQKRCNVFRLRLTQVEREHWEVLAEEVGLGNNLSKFVRHCVERRTLPAPIPEINRETYWELGKIGVNLNQIAHAVNRAIKEGSAIAVDPRPEILSVTKKLDEIRFQLLNLQQGGKP